MPNTTASRIGFLWDLFVGFLNLAIGRLLPTLNVPKTELAHRTAIVTGGNSGIGFQIALELARRGATVHLACRNASKGDLAVSQITNQIPNSHGRVEVHPLDTSSLASVRAFAKEWKARGGRIDVLMHNAGVASVPEGQNLFTPDGFPLLYATNFLGPFLLTHLLERYLATDARIISTTSTGHYAGSISASFALDSVKNRIEPGFHTSRMSTLNGKVPADSDVYTNTKLMQVGFVRLLQQYFDRELRESGQHRQRMVHCFTPGFTSTPMIDKLNIRSLKEDPVWWALRTTAIFATDPQQGAATGVWLATTQDQDVVGEGNGGGYWDRMTRRVSKVEDTDPDVVQRLWVRWEADAGIEWR
ncbi:MAG: hypothetical protein L6R38_002936 [Xanthoria sp. 2 TBL-2021]|nr:MAG: hypothetical protein L6R38_002936 [Xanthoria sp. 2 TBL-2021]